MADKNYKQESWNLGDLFDGFDSPDMAKALEQIEEEVSEFESFRSQLSDTLNGETFMSIIWAYEKLDRLLSRLYGYASLRFSADTQDQRAQTNLAKIRQVAADVDNRSLFFKLWWKRVDDNFAQELTEGAGDFRYWLQALRKERPYTLSEAEERVINLKDVNGSQALITVLSTITDRYIYNLEVDGQDLELNREELRSYFYHVDPAIRQAAYQEHFRLYEQDKSVIGQIYQYRVMDWHSEQVQLRNFESPIDVRNLSNDIPSDVIETLLEVCRLNAPLFQRYYRLKAKWLGMERLRRYDINAPVIEADRQYSFKEAVDLVLSSFYQFDPAVAEQAELVFTEGHIDSEVRKGKRAGAFCSTLTPDLTPWVLQSFRGRPEDVSTMAHELGHAVHSLLANHHSALSQHASLPLAETASTFGEMIVLDRLLSDSSDPQLKVDLLFRNMDRNYSAIMRQAFFAIFERDAHARFREGATIDEISALYGANLSEQFGESVEIGDEFHLEWLTIPHFFRYPFYVYAYTFGQLLVLALYQQYLADAEDFKPRYLAILASGGSDAPLDILDRVGIDVRAAGFWQGGFDVLAATVEELEGIKMGAIGT
jgi:oligoendopeptidase F